MLIVVSFLLSSFCSDSVVSREQLAVNYFFDVVWNEKYPKYRSLQFTDMTDCRMHEYNAFYFKQLGNEIINKIESAKVTQSIHVIAQSINVKIKRKCSLWLCVGTSVKVDEFYYVTLDLAMPGKFIDHYLIKFDDRSKIIDICNSHEIILGCNLVRSY